MRRQAYVGSCFFASGGHQWSKIVHVLVYHGQEVSITLKRQDDRCAGVVP